MKRLNSPRTSGLTRKIATNIHLRHRKTQDNEDYSKNSKAARPRVQGRTPAPCVRFDQPRSNAGAGKRELFVDIAKD